MAENVNITPGSGDVIGADDISSVKYQRVKMIIGADGTNDGDVASGNPLPTTEANSTAILADTASIDTNCGTIAGDTTSIDGKITACNTGAVVLAAGTAGIGKLTANSGVDIGDVDVTSIPDATTDTNWFQATITSADASSATQVKAKTADKKIHIVSLVISTDTAMNIQLQSDNGTPQVVMEQIYLAANGGMALTFPERFPLQVNTNEDLDVIASAAGNISVTAVGYVK